MKVLKIALVVIITAALINFVRGGADFALPRVIPLCDGKSPSLPYLLGGLALILICMSGLHRIKRRVQTTDKPKDFETVDSTEGEEPSEYELESDDETPSQDDED